MDTYHRHSLMAWAQYKDLARSRTWEEQPAIVWKCRRVIKKSNKLTLLMLNLRKLGSGKRNCKSHQQISNRPVTIPTLPEGSGNGSGMT